MKAGFGSGAVRSILPTWLTDATLVAVAVTYGLLLEIAGAAGWFGMPLTVLVGLSLCRYGYQQLRHTAQGRRTLAAPGIESMNPFGDFSEVLHFGVFAALVALFTDAHRFVAGAGGVWLDGLVLAGLALVFPASAALMALTGDLAAAFTPRRIAGLVAVLGRGYWRCLVFAAGALLLVRVVSLTPLPIAIRAGLESSLRVWALLALFGVIGAAVRARRGVLDIPGEQEPEDERQRRERREDWRRQLDLAYASIRSGLTAEGYRTIRELVAAARPEDGVHEWLLEQMLEWEDPTHATAVAITFIESLLEQGEPHRALDVAARWRRIGGLRLDPPVADALARHARSVGRAGIADDLLEWAAHGTERR